MVQGGALPEVLQGGRGAGGVQGDLAPPLPWTRDRVPPAGEATPPAGAGGGHLIMIIMIIIIIIIIIIIMIIIIIKIIMIIMIMTWMTWMD